MGRPTTHGMRALAVRLNGGGRLEKRTARALAKIQRALTMQPLENLHAFTAGHLSRFELILQGYQAHHLANPDAPPTPHMLALANAWRRTAELFAQLEAQLAEREKHGTGTTCSRCHGVFNDLQTYLSHPCSAPPAPATVAVGVDAPATMDDAAAMPAASEGSE